MRLAMKQPQKTEEHKFAAPWVIAAHSVPVSLSPEVAAFLLMKPYKNLTNRQFGRLTVVGYDHDRSGKGTKHRSYWLCKCTCGKTKSVVVTSLLMEKGTRSCGCLHEEKFRTIIHNCARLGKPTPEYRTWVGMKARTQNKNHLCYNLYGGRGITICERWNVSFLNFLADMGRRPPGMTIERIDTNGNYEPGNCKWADMVTQQNNRRNNHLVTFNNQTKTLAQWGKEYNINPIIILKRINRGWRIEDAITMPSQPSGFRYS